MSNFSNDYVGDFGVPGVEIKPTFLVYDPYSGKDYTDISYCSYIELMTLKGKSAAGDGIYYTPDELPEEYFVGNPNASERSWIEGLNCNTPMDRDIRFSRIRATCNDGSNIDVMNTGNNLNTTLNYDNNDKHFNTGELACASIKDFNTESYYLSNIDGRPALGLFSTIENNVTRDNFIANIPDEVFDQIENQSFISNGTGRFVKKTDFQTSGLGNDSYKPMGDWGYISYDGSGFNITNGNTPSDGYKNSYIQSPDFNTNETQQTEHKYYWELMMEFFDSLGYQNSSLGTASTTNCTYYFKDKYGFNLNSAETFCGDLDSFNGNGSGAGTANGTIGYGTGGDINSNWEHALDLAGYCNVDLNPPCQSDNGVAYSVVNPPQINEASNKTDLNSINFTYIVPSDNQFGYSGYYPYLSGYDHNLAESSYQYAKWVQGTSGENCYSYGRCLEFEADNDWDNISETMSKPVITEDSGLYIGPLFRTITVMGDRNTQQNYNGEIDIGSFRTEEDIEIGNKIRIDTISVRGDIESPFERILDLTIGGHNFGSHNNNDSSGGTGDIHYNFYTLFGGGDTPGGNQQITVNANGIISYSFGISAQVDQGSYPVALEMEIRFIKKEILVDREKSDYILRLTNGNEYRTLNQYQKIYDGGDVGITNDSANSINPYSSLKVSFMMRTDSTHSSYDALNPPHVESAIVRSNPSDTVTDVALKDEYLGLLGDIGNNPYYFPSNQYHSPKGYHNSITSNAQNISSYFGAMNRFKNNQPDVWEKKEFTFNVGDFHLTSGGESMFSLWFLIQASSARSGLGFRGSVLIDNFEVKESYDFLPDVDIRKKKGPNDYGVGDLTKYYDSVINPEEYKDTQAPLEAQFYFYPKYFYNNATSKEQSIIYNDFRNEMFYLYNVDWGDGSPPEFLSEPKQLRENTAVHHTYETSGIYEIKGTMLRMKPSLALEKVGVTINKRFVVKINVNPGTDEDFTYFGSNGFTFIPYKNTVPVIGGYSEQSIYYKSLRRQLGIVSHLSFSTQFRFFPNENGNPSSANVLVWNFPLLEINNENIPTQINRISSGINFAVRNSYGMFEGDLQYLENGEFYMFGITGNTEFNWNTGYSDTVNTEFKSDGDRLKTEMALSKLNSSFDYGLDLFNEFKRERYSESDGTGDIVHNGIPSHKSELGRYLGDTDITNIRYFNKPKQMWEMLGFNSELGQDLNNTHVGNPASPKYWKRIIPENYSIYNREGLIDGEFIDTYSEQNWLQSGLYYYPVLPKYGADGKFIEGVYPFYANEHKKPFPENGPITDDNYTETSLKVSLSTELIEGNVFDDKSGNKNYGFAIGDYKPKFDGETLKPEIRKTMSQMKTTKNNGVF